MEQFISKQLVLVKNNICRQGKKGVRLGLAKYDLDLGRNKKSRIMISERLDNPNVMCKSCSQGLSIFGSW